MNIKTDEIVPKINIGKLYYELDWKFIELMAQRMALNKDKYAPWSWKNISLEDTKQAITRHFIEIQKGNYSDEQILGHFIALALNSMFAVHTLNRE